jgi:LDH2 family malate/lactate/ureidoglycolate dehydrogenase
MGRRGKRKCSLSGTYAWMSGRSAYYVEMIAKHGLVAIHTAASSPLVAPPGGIRPVLGTNPIAIAVPSSRGPIVLDMGTSAYMMTEVMLRQRLGELLPEGVALGPGGEPTGIQRRHDAAILAKPEYS